MTIRTICRALDITYAEAAERTGVSESTVQRWATQGVAPTTRAVLDRLGTLEADAEERIVEAERYCPSVRARLDQDYALVAIGVAHPLDRDSVVCHGLVMRPMAGRDLLLYPDGTARNIPRDWRRRQ